MHLLILRVTRGRALASVSGIPVLLLTTTGRRSGKRRTAPLLYFRDGANLVVVASNGGEDMPPAWWLNLQEQPEASVAADGTTRRVHAADADTKTRARLWETITQAFPGYAGYERRTQRPIPVVILTPED